MKLLLILLFLFLSVSLSYATKYDVEAVNCIIGEASGEGFKGMLAVAESIRVRGSLDGVYGCHAAHIATESNDTYDLAVVAWQQSSSIYWQWEANSWGSNSDIRKNHMDEKCSRVARIGRHTFFKC